MATKRNLMIVTVHRTGKGDEARFGARTTLPMGDANALEAETCAGHLLRAANAQLDYSKSWYRLAFYDCKTGKRMDFTFAP
jgi:hypothetical protein